MFFFYKTQTSKFLNPIVLILDGFTKTLLMFEGKKVCCQTKVETNALNRSNDQFE